MGVRELSRPTELSKKAHGRMLPKEIVRKADALHPRII